MTGRCEPRLTACVRSICKPLSIRKDLSLSRRWPDVCVTFGLFPSLPVMTACDGAVIALGACIDAQVGAVLLLRSGRFSATLLPGRSVLLRLGNRSRFGSVFD